MKCFIKKDINYNLIRSHTYYIESYRGIIIHISKVIKI